MSPFIPVCFCFLEQCFLAMLQPQISGLFFGRVLVIAISLFLTLQKLFISLLRVDNLRLGNLPQIESSFLVWKFTFKVTFFPLRKMCLIMAFWVTFQSCPWQDVQLRSTSAFLGICLKVGHFFPPCLSNIVSANTSSTLSVWQGGKHGETAFLNYHF